MRNERRPSGVATPMTSEMQIFLRPPPSPIAPPPASRRRPVGLGSCKHDEEDQVARWVHLFFSFFLFCLQFYLFSALCPFQNWKTCSAGTISIRFFSICLTLWSYHWLNLVNLNSRDRNRRLTMFDHFSKNKLEYVKKKNNEKHGGPKKWEKQKKMKKKKQNVTKKKTIKPALRGRLEREASRRPNVDLDANLHTTSPHLLHPQQQSPTSASGNKEKKAS